MDLVTKYNIPAPRYTSYPTVPYWDRDPSIQEWTMHVSKSYQRNKEEGLSLYIHLPFCESLCTYCACNTRITVNHKVEAPYIDSILKEWELYLQLFHEKPRIREIHLGGGTPTFFAPEQLRRLIEGILATSVVAKEHDFSFEGHPGNTKPEHLQTLYELGFRRVSFGIQDFDEKVQDTINRYQTFEEVKNVMNDARRIGYTSVNVDLVYGLPYQTSSSVHDTVEKIIGLKPERIAFYSYAHVPWIKPGQRKYSEKDLPADAVKRQLYETGRELFIGAGYRDIGMDHFALPGDALFDAFKNGTLHRNFMGYTAQHTKLLIGLGCSSISDTWDCFAQNIKTVEEYSVAVNSGQFPVTRGHVLNEEDLLIREKVLDIMCRHFTVFDPDAELLDRLKDLESDGLIHISGNQLTVTDTGKNFLRNICLVFDRRYWRKQPQKKIFSTTA